MASMLDGLQITDFQKGLLRERWLDQVTWMSAQSRRAHRRYLTFRIPVVVGGVFIPALITLMLSANGTAGATITWLGGIPVDVIRFLAFTVSLAVALCAGIEEVFHFGDRWRHYRRTTELLKTLGWQYLMLSGAFRRYSSHTAAFTTFAERVEDTLNEDVEGYLGSIAGDSPDRKGPEIIA
jgi:phosphoserine phosphatase